MSPTGPNKHRFTIHFDVSNDTFALLSHLGKEHKCSPNDVALNILLAWMHEVADSATEKELAESVKPD